MRPMLFQARQIEWRKRTSSLLAVRADAVRRRDQPGLKQVAVRPKRAFLGKLGGIGANRGDRASVRILDVDVERARTRIFEARDGLIAGADAVDRQTPHAARILFEIRIAEDADRARIGLDLLDD